MRKIEIIPAEDWHVAALGIDMRPADCKELQDTGIEPYDGLEISYRASLYAMTGIVDGVVSAMWGVGGTPMGLTGIPWLLTGPECDKIPVSFIKIALSEIDKMKRLFPRLENIVTADYTGAVRMLEMAGFSLSDPFPLVKTGALVRHFFWGA